MCAFALLEWVAYLTDYSIDMKHRSQTSQIPYHGVMKMFCPNDGPKMHLSETKPSFFVFL